MEGKKGEERGGRRLDWHDAIPGSEMESTDVRIEVPQQGSWAEVGMCIDESEGG